MEFLVDDDQQLPSEENNDDEKSYRPPSTEESDSQEEPHVRPIRIDYDHLDKAAVPNDVVDSPSLVFQEVPDERQQPQPVTPPAPSPVHVPTVLLPPEKSVEPAQQRLPIMWFVKNMLGVALASNHRLLTEMRNQAVDAYKLKYGREPERIDGEPHFAIPRDLDCFHAALQDFVVPPPARV